MTLPSPLVASPVQFPAPRAPADPTPPSERTVSPASRPPRATLPHKLDPITAIPGDHPRHTLTETLLLFPP
jgi:hypothetical protein